MTATHDLHEVIETQAELTESLATVLREQQEAIINARADELSRLVEQSETLVQPIKALEKERVRLSAQLTPGTPSSVQGKPATADELLKHVDAKDASSLALVISRLREASKEVLKLNTMNKPLLEHSQHFIRQTLRAATDDFKKNLVDRKI